MNCEHLLRFLFKNERKARKELESFLRQNEQCRSKGEFDLSDETQTCLRDKLLVAPQQTSCLLHYLIISSIVSEGAVAGDESHSLAETLENCDQKTEDDHTEDHYSFVGSVFKESLEHCLWRMENMDEKLMKLQEEYNGLLNRQKKNISMRSNLMIDRKGLTFSLEAKHLEKRIEAAKKEKCRNEDLFYKILSLSKDTNSVVLKELFPKTLQIYYKKKLVTSPKIYLSHLSSSSQCLRDFCEKEEKYLNKISHPKNVEQIKEIISYAFPNIREIFFHVTKYSKHVFQFLFKMLINNPVTSMNEINECSHSSWLTPLWPLIFLSACSSSPGMSESFLSAASVWENRPNISDPLLAEVCSDVYRDLKLVHWCIAHGSMVKPLPLLQVIKDHSPLYALHRAIPLHTLWPEEVMDLLEEHSISIDPSGNLSSACRNTYKAFCILFQMFQIIRAGMCLDNAVAGWKAREKLVADNSTPASGDPEYKNEEGVAFKDQQSFVSFYQQNIVEKLEEVRNMVDSLQCLEYRLEILENMFSLLFLRHSEMSDEGHSESGGEEGDHERSLLSQHSLDIDLIASPEIHRAVEVKFQESTNPPDAGLCNASNVSVGEEVMGSSSSTQDRNEESYIKEDMAPTNTEPDENSQTAVESLDALQCDNQHFSPQSGMGLYQQSSCTVSGKSTGSSINELPRTGFLINSLVAWDILLLLRDSVLATSAQTYSELSRQQSVQKDSSRQAVQSRLSYLSRCISEGLWRLQVVAPCKRKLGSLENFDDYVSNTLLHKVPSTVIYDGPIVDSTSATLSGQTEVSQGVKKRHVKGCEPIEAEVNLREQTSIMNYLLASYSSLIALALACGNLPQAEQVVKMYKVGDTAQRREVYLASQLLQLKHNLSNTNQKTNKVKSVKVQGGGCSQDMMNIGLLAREGSAQVGATNLIHDLVISSPPPVPSGMREAASNNCPIAATFLSPQALVLTDLALTADVTETTAVYLLEQALQRKSPACPPQTANLTAAHDIVGYIPLLKEMAAVCSSIINVRKSGKNVSQENLREIQTSCKTATIGPQQATPVSLLLSVLPLGSKQINTYMNSWSRVLQSISDVEQELSLFATQHHSRRSRNIKHRPQENKLHVAYKGLLHIMSEEAQNLYSSSMQDRKKGKMGAFIRSFYQYVQLLAAMVTQHASDSFIRNIKSYFSLLNHRPVHILGSLMFQEGVDPVRLEPLASRMRLDLVTVILQYCCPKITVSGKSLLETITIKSGEEANMLGFEATEKHVIMNAGSNLRKPGVHGEVVVRDILTTLLSGLHEVILPVNVSPNIRNRALILDDSSAPEALLSPDVLTSLRDTADLACIEFDKMVQGEEALVFFINLANLMFIHAALLNHILYPKDRLSVKSEGIFSNYQLERIMAMKRLGYTLGELGFLSLYDVVYHILLLQNPLSSILVHSNLQQKFELCESSLLDNSLQIKTGALQQISKLLTTLPIERSFLVTQGTPFSPRVQVIYADRLQEQVESAVSEHLSIFLTVEDAQNTKANINLDEEADQKITNTTSCLTTTRTVLDFLAKHPDGIISAVQFLQGYLPKDSTAAHIQRLVAVLQDGSRLDVSVLDKSECRGIVLEVMETYDADSEDSSETVEDECDLSSLCESPLIPSSWLTVKVPHTVISYLRKQCPLLAFIVQSLHNALEMSRKAVEPESCENTDLWLNILYPPSKGVVPPADETDKFQACRNLFLIKRHRTLAQIHHGNRIVSALNHKVERSTIWHQADQLLGSGAVTKDTSAVLTSRVSSMVVVLQSLPTSTLRKYPDLILLRNHLIKFLVQAAPLTGDPAPWLFALQITDSEMRFDAVLAAHKDWPASAALKLLRVLVHDDQLLPDQHEWVQNRTKQIEVYDKIVEAGVVESWQETEKMSMQEPTVLLKTLLQRKHFELGVQWAEHHDVKTDSRRLVDQNYLMSLLDKTSPDYSSATEALHNLSLSDILIVIPGLLSILSTIPTRRFLIHFLLNTLLVSESDTEHDGHWKLGISSESSLEKKSLSLDLSVCEDDNDPSSSLALSIVELQQEVMGLILVEDVAPPAGDRFQLSHLASTPYLIIEQWLMNVRFEAVGKGIRVLRNYLDLVDSTFSSKIDLQDPKLRINEDATECLNWKNLNNLLETYAAKALDTASVPLTIDPQSSGRKNPKKFVVPTQPPKRQDWIPDNEVAICPVCNSAKFSMFCRRHHCRRCGRVVCHSCSKSRMTVQGYGNMLVRTCADCYQHNKNICLQDYTQVRPLGESASDRISLGSGSLHSTARGSLSPSDTEGGWYLARDSHYNSIVRQEFSYDYAPSVSLCLSILAHHQDQWKAAMCAVNLAHNLFVLVTSVIQSTSHEVDVAFVLSMIPTLLASSKVRFANVNDHDAVMLCEYYIQNVDILSLLLKSNCVHIIPQKVLSVMLQNGDLHQKVITEGKDFKVKLKMGLRSEFFLMRQLRDNLLKEQLWKLALEISTKKGLEANDVWRVRAMASLKAGDFHNARGYFSRVLDRPTTKNRPTRSCLLPEIVKHLKKNPFQTNEKVIEEAKKSRESVENSEYSRFLPSQALVVLHSIHSLNEISNGSLMKKRLPKQSHSNQNYKRETVMKMQPLFQNECKYYLHIYGNHQKTVEFYMHNWDLQGCMEYILREEVDKHIFTDEVFVPCLRYGLLGNLVRVLNNIDPEQEKWAKYMLKGCLWLEQHRWWNCLLAVQEALGDRLRAAMTLLRMYSHAVSSYIELSNRLHYLTSAKAHFQAYLDSECIQDSSDKKKPLVVHMSGWQVNQHINILSLQADITKFLALCEIRGKVVTNFRRQLMVWKMIGRKSLPTLLGGSEQQLAVAALLVCSAQVIAEGVALAFQIVEGNTVFAEKLLSLCCQLLVQENQFSAICQVVKGMQEWSILAPLTVDMAIKPAILAAASKTEITHLDALVRLLSNQSAKIEAYVECGRLKSAYLVGVHHGSLADVRRVQEVALRNGQAHVATMCTKWIANYENRVGNR